MDFKFTIGQIVTTKVGIEEAKLHCEAGHWATPNLLMVVELFSQGCPGGVQLHYACSSQAGKVQLNEIELALPSDFDAAKMAENVAAVLKAKRNEEHRSTMDLVDKWSKKPIADAP